MENYAVINGKKFALTDEQSKLFADKLQYSPFERAPDGCAYYYIERDGIVEETHEHYEYSSSFETDIIAVGNYCTDKELMQQRALHEALDRLLWRFSCENGELENPWDGSRSH